MRRGSTCLECRNHRNPRSIPGCAGCLARAAGVKTVIPFHFSPRCNGREAELRDEVAAAFAGTGAPR